MKKLKNCFHNIVLFMVLTILVCFFTSCSDKQEAQKNENLEQADSSIESVLQEEGFDKLDEPQKAQKVEEALEEMEQEGVIKEGTIEYSEKEKMYTFEYSDGILGGVWLEERNDEWNEKGTNNQNSGETENQKSEDNNSTSELKALILNAFENVPKRRDFYENLESEWENMDVDTTVDVDVTVEDLKTLNEYDIVTFSMHGTRFRGESVLCLNEVVTDETDGKYAEELANQSIARVMDSNRELLYIVFDDFFENEYEELTSKVIFSETCQFYGCECEGDIIDFSYANTLYELSQNAIIGYRNSVEMNYSRDVMEDTIGHMLQGDVVSEALEKAINSHGENDDWEDAADDKYYAFPILTGNSSVTLVEIPVTDFSIPEEKVMTLGEISVIEPEIKPENATDYTIKWTSSDENIATVSESGILTGKAKGETVITATLTSAGKTITKSTKLRVASKGRDTILVLDVSGSMSGSPLIEMKEAAIDFCKELLEDEYNNRVGLVFYDDYIEQVELTNDLDSLIAYIDNVGTGGTTDMEAGLSTAVTMLDISGAQESIKNIVIMADGLPNEGKTSSSGSMKTQLTGYLSSVEHANAVIDTAQIAMQKYNLYSLGFFHDLNGDSLIFATELMSQLTNQEDGYHEVVDAENLQFAFGDISEEIIDGSKIVINIACPVDVSITYNGETLSSAHSTYNDKTSFGSLQLLGSNKDIKVVSLKAGVDYDVKLSGTGHGVMNYSVNYMDENEEVTDARVFERVPITPTTRMSSTTRIEAKKVSLEIDEDGDGIIDTIWSALENEKGKITFDLTPDEDEEISIELPEIEENTMEAWQIALIGISAISVMGIIVVIIIVCISRKPDKDGDRDEEDDENGFVAQAHGEFVVEQKSDERITEDKEEKSCTPSISILSGPMMGAEIPIKVNETIYIGKDTKRANIVFAGDFPHLSRLHCSVMYDEKYQKYYVTDSSQNGTYYLGNTRLEKGKRTPLSPGTILTLANDKARIRLN